MHARLLANYLLRFVTVYRVHLGSSIASRAPAYAYTSNSVSARELETKGGGFSRGSRGQSRGRRATRKKERKDTGRDKSIYQERPRRQHSSQQLSPRASNAIITRAEVIKLISAPPQRVSNPHPPPLRLYETASPFKPPVEFWWRRMALPSYKSKPV